MKRGIIIVFSGSSQHKLLTLSRISLTLPFTIRADSVVLIGHESEQEQERAVT